MYKNQGNQCKSQREMVFLLTRFETCLDTEQENKEENSKILMEDSNRIVKRFQNFKLNDRRKTKRKR